MNKQKIKWLLFHEPAELFIRTAEHFEKEINRLTGDRYEIEILKLEDYNTKYNNGQPCDPLAELKIGGFTNGVLGKTLGLERALIRMGLSFPAGGSLLLAARKIA